jgi:iron complex outermembrane receptor protein
MQKANLRRLLMLGCCGAAALGAPAAAQSASGTAASDQAAEASDALEDIVVTARRRAENLQTTPVAITAISADMLEARNVISLERIAQIAPNVVTYQSSGAIGAAANFIRGIGYTEFVLGQDAPVGIYVDGVYRGRNNVALLQLVQPERVEVLRGPQGTLFGRNTTGGAMSITSRTPADDPNGEVKASYGSFGAAHFQARVDTGLIADSGIKLSAAYQHRQQDGTTNDLSQPSNRDPGAYKSDAIWIKMVGEWGKFSMDFSVDYNEIEGVPPALQIIDATAAIRNFIALSSTYGGTPYTITRDPQFTFPGLGYGGQQRIKDHGLALTLNYELTDNLALKSISARRAYNRNDPVIYGPSKLRGNFGTVAEPRIAEMPGIYSITPRSSRQRQWTQEFQVLGTSGDFDYVLGFFYLHEKGRETGRSRLPSGVTAAGTAVDFASVLDYNVVNKSVAGFAQVNWRPSALDQKLELTGGVRWTKDTKNLDQRSTVRRTGELTTKNTSFLASVKYQWTDDVMTYVRYSTGYRSGGFALRAAANVDPVYTPEKLKSWEAGFKMEAFDRRLRLNGAVFYNKYHDLQVTRFIPISLQDSGGNTPVNANATYKGFELELLAVPTDGLTLNAMVGYVDPKYKRFPVALLAGGALTPGCAPILSGTATVAQDCAAVAVFSSVSKSTINLGAAYEFEARGYGKWSARIDWVRTGTTNFGSVNNPATNFTLLARRKPYSLVNGRIQLSDIPLSGNVTAQIALYGDNLLNKKYSTNTIDWGFMSTSLWGARRTVGVEGKIEF